MGLRSTDEEVGNPVCDMGLQKELHEVGIPVRDMGLWRSFTRFESRFTTWVYEGASRGWNHSPQHGSTNMLSVILGRDMGLRIRISKSLCSGDKSLFWLKRFFFLHVFMVWRVTIEWGIGNEKKDTKGLGRCAALWLVSEVSLLLGQSAHTAIAPCYGVLIKQR